MIKKIALTVVMIFACLPFLMAEENANLKGVTKDRGAYDYKQLKEAGKSLKWMYDNGIKKVYWDFKFPAKAPVFSKLKTKKAPLVEGDKKGEKISYSLFGSAYWNSRYVRVLLLAIYPNRAKTLPASTNKKIQRVQAKIRRDDGVYWLQGLAWSAPN